MTKKYTFGFYCENSEDDVEALRLDFYEMRYEFIHDMHRKQIGKGAYGDVFPEVMLSREHFSKLSAVVRETFCGGTYSLQGYEDDDDLFGEYGSRLLNLRYREREPMPKERVFAAIRRESEELIGLAARCEYYESADYFDAEAMLSGVRAFLRGDMTAGTFADWAIVLMRAFGNYGPYRGNRYLWEFYNDLADAFDGIAFTSCDCTDDDTRRAIKKFYAELKYAVHRRGDLLAKTDTPFEKNGVIVYFTFAFSVECAHEVYQLCVVDMRKKRINFLQADDPEFDEDIDYTPLSKGAFERLLNRYSDYILDRSLTADYQKHGGDMGK